MTDVGALREFAAVLESLIAEHLQVQQLSAHWRVCALHAETGDERETWIICADQLDAVLVLMERPS